VIELYWDADLGQGISIRMMAEEDEEMLRGEVTEKILSE
jgi:hypothetical protein